MLGSLLLYLALAVLIASHVAADLLSDIETALENAVDCASGHVLMVPLQALAALGNDAFVDTIVAICQDFNLEDDDVCAGAIGEQGPILAHDLRQISATGQTASKFLDAVFGLCQPPAVNAFTVPFPSAAPTNPKAFVSSGKAPFQVIHFSDVHIDRSYTVGSEANCTKPICCRNFEDQTGSVTEPAEPNGNSRCDSPVSLADSMLEAAQHFGGSARFSIFTGDVVEGEVWLVNQTEVTGDLEAFNAEMASKLGAPVFGAIAPVNSFPRNTTTTTIDSQWVFDTQSAGWTRWINSSAANQLDHMSGSYSVIVPGTDLKIISVNTQYWYKQNFWVYDSDTQQTDPNGILGFMVQELQSAEDAGQRACIIGHMPLGKEDALNDQSNYYDQIVQRYKNTIAVQFFGHSHKDQFEIAYSDYNDQTASTATSVALIAPALTPTSGNPAFKIYDIDPDTFEVIDAREYIANISSPGFQTQPTWELYYSARDSYGPLVGNLGPTDALNASFWHKLTEVFESDDDAFQLYNARLSRETIAEVTACTDDCKNTAICDMRALRAENNCDTATAGISFKRDTHEHSSESDACEGTGAARIMRKLRDRVLSGSVRCRGRLQRKGLPSSSLQRLPTDRLRKRLEAVNL
ncbi:sphingomyelin phosphodiesterase [Punctularia strigosozonata HHB-11173 SS5]|uniref:sphingomyelin phosphodiesterase n=1 Tax=Punctularia strigosozonata (strain HHB-11173) TaxID=741275 RepID=UPI0004418142|nr:sphingomyelin phosphodiesterase [Punctularia strigosozonata HHB-11173 SS5]EIN09661.1 sphingomyelin phosphodiesterase [Punctularia strigosozonata HHB-11173 SS5]